MDHPPCKGWAAKEHTALHVYCDLYELKRDDDKLSTPVGGGDIAAGQVQDEICAEIIILKYSL